MSIPRNLGNFADNVNVNGKVEVTGINATGTPSASTVLYGDGTWAVAGGGSSQWTTNGTNIYYNTGNVGIGTTAPTATGNKTLEINGNASTDSAINLSVGGTRYGIHYAATSVVVSGSHASVPYALYTGNTERMRVDTSGNVGIGVTPSAWASNSAIQVGTVGGLQSMASVANQIALRGNMYWNGGDKFLTGSGYASSLAIDGTGGFIFYTSTAASGGAGTSASMSQRMTLDTGGNLQLQKNMSVGNATPTTSGSGITFPATQSASSDANTLDDYEEGTWTPTFNVASGTPSGTGTYVKIGNQVTLCFSNNTGSITTVGGTSTITGLPFASNTISGRSGGVGACSDTVNTSFLVVYKTGGGANSLYFDKTITVGGFGITVTYIAS